MKTISLVVGVCLCWAVSPGVWAQEQPPPPSPAAVSPAPAALPPVVARYEQMLAGSPGKGTAFDKVYQHFFEGAGLDALAARWHARATGGAPGAEMFLLLEGLLAERRARPDEARERYQQSTRAHPEDPRGWTALGELETAEGRFGPSADALAHALAPEARPPLPAATRPTIYRELARAQTRNFLVANALTTWRKLAAEFPDDPTVLQEVGEALQEGQSYDDARGTFEKLRDIAGRNGDAFGKINATLHLGQVEEARGHAAEAVKVYEGVVADAKAGSWLEREARARIEQLYRSQEDLPGLADYYKKWLEDHPRDIDVATRRGAVLVELNRKAEAIDLLKQAVAWAPDRQELQVELAHRLAESDRPAEAAAVMEKLTVVAPEEKSYWVLLGDARWQLLASNPPVVAPEDKTKWRQQALDAWNHLAPPDSKDAIATGRLADLLAEHHLADEALAQFARAAALAPDLPDLRERWAAYLVQLGRKEDARRVLAGIVDADPRNATAANFARLATALDRLDDGDGALDATARGLALEPRSFDLLSQRWQLLSARKRWDDAIALYPTLLAAAPNVYFTEQVQMRHVSALAAADKLADFRKTLGARLVAVADPTKGAPLDEGDLGLLIRADLQSAGGGSEEDAVNEAKRALAQGRERFPRSAALVRLEVELAKRAHDAPAQVAALRRLVELQPAQKIDALQEIVRVWRDADKPDDALAAANELLAASPANTSSHLLLADLLLQAGRPDEGLARLREAVRLSDKPNEVRLRLARAESELGHAAESRQVLDAAFEAAADARERLTLTKPLAEAYQREGKLDELIGRFQHLQQAEADGWRYALYLADIYEQTQDSGGARRELAKALAARPKDGSLLRQLVRLATDEDNTAEAARYQALLTEAEPSNGNQLALVRALLANNQGDEAINALQAHLTAILKTPGAWDDLLPLLAKNQLTGKAGAMLARELGGEKADLSSRFTLALFQISAGDIDGAKAALWSIFAAQGARTPAAPLPPPPTAATTTGMNSSYMIFYGAGNSIAELRVREAEQKRPAAQQLLDPTPNQGRTFYQAQVPGNVSAARPDPVDTARDGALIYLAAIAVKQNAAAEFLVELDRQLAARESSRTDRLVAYATVDAKEKLLSEIAAQVRTPEEGLDMFCVGRLFSAAFYNGPQYRRYANVPPLTDDQMKAMLPLGEPLLRRAVQAYPEVEEIKESAWYSFLRGLDQKEPADAIRREVLARADAQAPLRQLGQALGLLMEGDFSAPERTQLRTVARAISEQADKSRLPAVSRRDYTYYPTMIFQPDSQASKLPAEEFAGVLADLLTLWYPSSVPPPGAGALPGPTTGPGNYYNRSGTPRDEQFLPATRYLTPEVQLRVQQLGQMLRQGDDARGKSLRVQLARQARELPPAQRVFPALLSVYLDFWGGDAAGAAAGAKALQEAHPEDTELRLLTAMLLGRGDKPAEAVALLGRIDAPRTGETAITIQQAILVFARAAHNDDAAKEAALKLAAMRLPADERQLLANDLRELGLNEKADQLAHAPGAIATGGSRRSGQPRPTSIFDYQTAQQLQTLERDKNEGGALALVRNVLAALPPPDQSQGNVDYVLQQAVSTLERLHKRDDFIAVAERQLAKDPDSLSLNYQLAVLHGGRDEQRDSSDSRFRVSGNAVPAPVWLRLRRNGDEVVGSYSADGQNWQTLGHQTVALGDKLLAALPVTGRAASRDPDKGKTVGAFVDQVTLTPDPAAGPAAAPSAAPPSLPAPWVEAEVRPVSGFDGKVPPASTAPVPASTALDVFALHGNGGTANATQYTGGLIYRPAGDAKELVARVVSFEDTGGEATAGIMWRAALAADAPYVSVLVTQNHMVVFQYRLGPGPALQYWRKLVVLRPKNGHYARRLIEQLARHGQREEAVAIFESLIVSDPDEALGNSLDYRTIYTKDQMPRLAERLLAWKPASATAPGRARSVGNAFVAVAQSCADQNRGDLAIALCKHGIALDEAAGYAASTPELSKLLLKTLLATNRRDEARDVVVAGLVPPSVKETRATRTAGGPTLGFQNQPSYGRNYRSNWMWNISWSENGIEMRGLDPLETARQEGMLPELEGAIRARLVEPDAKQLTDTGLDWLLTICRLYRHDPTLIDELPAQINAKPGSNQNFTNNPHAYAGLMMTIGRFLQQWPGHEMLALEALRVVAKLRTGSVRTTGGNLGTMIGLPEARAEMQLGDAATAIATLRDIVGKPASPSNSVNTDTVRRSMALLLRAGPEADPIYIDLYDRVSKGEQGAQDYHFAYGLEKKQRLGNDPHFTALAWLLDDGGDGPEATCVYEVRARHPYDNSGLGKYPASRGRSFPGSEGERTLTFHYGPDAEHFAPIGQLRTAATFGTWKGPVPPGSGVLKVTIDTPREADAKPLADEAAAGPAALPKPGASPTPAASPAPPAGDYYLRVVRSANLLVNPNFEGLPNRDANAEKFSLPGWKDLPAGFWLAGTLNGPRPGKAYVQCEVFPRAEHIVYGERIPLEKGRAYFQSGWLREAGDGSGNKFGRRYLDADGKVLKTTECPDASMLMWRWDSQRLQPGTGGKDDDVIPERAAFIEPFLKFTGAVDWTGLFIGKTE